MIRFPSLDPDMMAPSKAVLLESLRIPADRASERHNEWAESALRRYLELVRPAMVVQPVSVKEFRGIYKGEGRNESPAPLDKVFPHAFRLALFALQTVDLIAPALHLALQLAHGLDVPWTMWIGSQRDERA